MEKDKIAEDDTKPMDMMDADSTRAEHDDESIRNGSDTDFDEKDTKGERDETIEEIETVDKDDVGTKENTKPSIEEISSYTSMNLKYIPFLCKMMFAWIFGFSFMATTMCGYYAYLSQSMPLWLTFMFLFVKYMFGFWYSVFTFAMVLMVELVIHRKKVGQFIELTKMSYRQAKQSMQLNKELQETINKDQNFDLGNVNGNVERFVEYIGKAEVFYGETCTMVTSTKLYQISSVYCDKFNVILHQEKFQKILLKVDFLLETFLKFVKKIICNIPVVGPHASKFFKDIENVDMVHFQHKYDEFGQLGPLNHPEEPSDGLSTRVFEDDDSTDVISNESDEKKSIQNKTRNIDSPTMSFNRIDMEAELDQLLKAVPPPSTPGEENMKKQLEMLAKMKPPTQEDMQNMDVGKMAEDLQQMMQMMGTLGSMAGQLKDVSVDLKKKDSTLRKRK